MDSSNCALEFCKEIVLIPTLQAYAVTNSLITFPQKREKLPDHINEIRGAKHCGARWSKLGFGAAWFGKGSGLRGGRGLWEEPRRGCRRDNFEMTQWRLHLLLLPRHRKTRPCIGLEFDQHRKKKLI